jgi:hypothetical protein
MLAYTKDSNTAVRYLFLSQCCLYGFLLLCTILMPHFLFERNEGGASNYGVHALTVIPYTLAFGFGGLLLIKAARTVPITAPARKRLRSVLTLLGVLLLIVLATTYPYKLNASLDKLHIFSAQLLFVAELAAGAWFASLLQRGAINLLLFAVQTIGSILALLTVLGLLHVLFVAQIIAGVAFAALMIRTTSWQLHADKHTA